MTAHSEQIGVEVITDGFKTANYELVIVELDKTELSTPLRRLYGVRNRVTRVIEATTSQLAGAIAGARYLEQELASARERELPTFPGQSSGGGMTLPN